jgi:drug/metabolite transporter (DMT)-like permease
MQETELDKEQNPTDHPSWWRRLLIGALVGCFFGALNIWFYEFSLARLLAAILGGATFFAIVGLLAVKFGKDRLKVIAVAGFAGFVAGALYWVVARPSSSPLLAIGIGLVGGIVYAWAESKG